MYYMLPDPFSIFPREVCVRDQHRLCLHSLIIDVNKTKTAH